MSIDQHPQPAVLFERRGHIGVLTLNRPEGRNSMTPELLDGFAATVQQVRADPTLRVLVVTGKGPSFSAGADFRSQIQRDVAHLTPAERSYEMYTPFLSLLDVSVPIIGALQGHAVGGGFGLALTCDLRIACESSKYGANFAKLGLHAGMAISYTLPRLVGVPKAMEWLLTGKLFSGRDGEAAGLFNRAVPADEVLPCALALADDIAAAAPIAVRLMKQTMYQNLEWNPRTAAFREAFAQAATVDSADCKEGVAALLEKRAPVFTGR
jgi:enoyl-CoA hydratase/carnithine racemase